MGVGGGDGLISWCRWDLMHNEKPLCCCSHMTHSAPPAFRGTGLMLYPLVCSAGVIAAGVHRGTLPGPALSNGLSKSHLLSGTGAAGAMEPLGREICGVQLGAASFLFLLLWTATHGQAASGMEAAAHGRPVWPGGLGSEGLGRREGALQ